MISTRTGRGALLIFGLLVPLACFDPGEAPSLESDTGSATGAAGESSSGDESAAAEDPCPQYCSLIADHCEPDLAQYSGQVICEATCALMDPGEPGDVLGNTASCRLHHATLAAESPEPHCLHAGPTGDTTCGGPCESFCSLAAVACTDELSPFGSTDGCIAECESWNPEPRYLTTVQTGDSYACRMYHLTLAAVQPAEHCSHIATDSPVCFDP